MATKEASTSKMVVVLAAGRGGMALGGWPTMGQARCRV